MAVKFDGDKLRFDLIPADALAEVALAYTIGAKKYGDRNWESGEKFKFSRLIAAAHRHINGWQRGEDRDPDGQHHLGAAIFCLLSILAYQLRGLGGDDRDPAPSLDQDLPPEKVTRVLSHDTVTVIDPTSVVIIGEIRRMRDTHPPLTNLLGRAALIFASEAFEVVQAVKKYTPGGTPSHNDGLTDVQAEHLKSELGQVAAVATAWIDNLEEARRRRQSK